MSLYEARGASAAPVWFHAPAHWPHRAVRLWASETLFDGGVVWSLQRLR